MANENSPIDLDADVEKNPEEPASAGGNSKRKNQKSDVWDHFVIPKPVPIVNPRCCCKYCRATYAYAPGTNGTSSLWNHLRRCKKYPFNKPEDKKQKTLFFRKTGGDDCGSLDAVAFNKEFCRKALSRMIVIDELAFRYVEREGFRYFCSVMQPKFGVPSRFTIARDIMSLYCEEKKRLKLMFKNSSQQVCLTTDTWTSIQNINYMVLTAHYIDDDWKLQKKILNFETISNHKGETIGKMIEACLIDWGIERVLTITVDNANSNDVALTYMKRKIRNWGKATLNCEFLHMRCCAHILNLVVTSGLKDYDRSIKVIRNAVRYVRSSPSRLNKFKQCIEHEKIDRGGSICLDVPTRWNSTFLMLESALKYKMAFERMEEDTQYLGYFKVDSSFENAENDHDACRLGPPCSWDWDAAEHFMRFLKLFYVVTKRFSGSLYVTSNLYFHDLCSMYSHITKCIKDTDKKLSLMASDMKVKFDKYWGDVEKINPLLFVAVVLDPRYKLKYIDWSFEELYGKNDLCEKNDLAERMSTKVKECLKKLFDQYCSQDPNNAKEGSSSPGTMNSSEKHDDESQDIYKNHLAKYKSFLKSDDGGEKSELDKYLKDEKESMDGDFDLLGWWKINSTKYKILSRIAKDVLAIPVSSVSSESAFSTGGRVLDAFRSSLTPKTVQALICAQDWLKSEVPQEMIDIQGALQEIEDLEKDFSNQINLSTDHIE